MRATIIRFPGSNCDHDVEHLYGTVLKENISVVWHTENDLKKPAVS